MKCNNSDQLSFFKWFANTATVAPEARPGCTEKQGRSLSPSGPWVSSVGGN